MQLTLAKFMPEPWLGILQTDGVEEVFLGLGAGRPTLCIMPHKDTVCVPNNGDCKEETETTVS